MKVEPQIPADQHDRPFVYVIYAHADAVVVHSDVARLVLAGFNVWYDDRSNSGREADAEIIERARVVLHFESSNSAAAERCRSELTCALDLDRAVVTVMLDALDVSELPPGLRMSLGARQAIVRARYDDDAYIVKLTEAIAAELEPPNEGKSAEARIGHTPAMTGRNLSDAPMRGMSLIVLPMSCVGGGDDAADLAAAITDDLATALGRIAGMTVISRGSVNAYQRSVDPRTIARELGVRYIVQGKLHTLGKRVHLNVRLVDAKTARQIDTERFDAIAEDVLEMTDELVRRIAGALQPSLVTAEATRATLEQPEHVDAWLLTQRAHCHFFFAGPDAQRSRESIELSERAIEKDPTYSYAYAASALIRAGTFILMLSDDPDRDVRLAREHGRRALDLAPDDPHVLWACGVVKAYVDGDPRGAIAFMERSVAGDPNNAHALADYGMALGRLDRPRDGAEQIRTAMWLSPKHPRAFLWHYFLADVDIRNPEQALIEINRSLALFEHQPAFAVKAFALLCLERVDEAKAAMKRMRALYPRITLDEMEEQIRRGTSQRADLQARLLSSIGQAWD